MYEYAEIDGYKHTIKGTELHVVIPKKSIGDKLKKFGKDGKVVVEMRIDDGRAISNRQRRAIFAIIKDMAKHTGHVDDSEYLRKNLMMSFMVETGEMLESLQHCSMTTAKEFITYLLKICYKYDINISKNSITLSDDIDLHMYLSTLYRKCSACAVPGAMIHHCTGSRVGAGNDRRKIIDIGRYIMPLCAKCHGLIHTMSEKDFYKDNICRPYLITEYNYKELKLREGDFFEEDLKRFKTEIEQ